MCNNNIMDDDVKIFHPDKKATPDSELTALAALMDKQRATGNSAKATFLGERLAEITPEKLCPEDIHDLNGNELIQIRSLIVFSIQIALHKYLPHTVLSTQAVNAMFAKIEENSPTFFLKISDGSAFSFYYLTIRNPVDVETEIGKNFAMLCDRGDDDKMVQLGTDIYRKADAKVLSMIDDFEFAD